jgi:hypothetical protein
MSRFTGVYEIFFTSLYLTGEKLMIQILELFFGPKKTQTSTKLLYGKMMACSMVKFGKIMVFLWFFYGKMMVFLW